MPFVLPLLGLLGCGGSVADVEGTALGITFGKTHHVYFGGPLLVISAFESECEDLAFVRETYEVGQVPTEADVALLQFAFAAEMSEGTNPVDLGASVNAAVVHGGGGAFEFEYAEGGVLDIDHLEAESVAEGSFEGVAFPSGTLNGSFTAEWCRNLKDR